MPTAPLEDAWAGPPTRAPGLVQMVHIPSVVLWGGMCSLGTVPDPGNTNIHPSPPPGPPPRAPPGNVHKSVPAHSNWKSGRILLSHVTQRNGSLAN